VHVDAPPGQAADDLLAVLAQGHRFEGQRGVCLDQAGHVADRRVGVKTEQEIRRSQVEEVQGV